MSSESLISFYHTGFVICLSFCILFLIISVVLFFTFRIRAIFNIRTGRAQKKKIEEMTAQNNLTGRLINSSAASASSTPSMTLSTKLNNIRSRGVASVAPTSMQRITSGMTSSGSAGAAPVAGPVTNINEGADQTTLLSTKEYVPAGTISTPGKTKVSTKSTKAIPAKADPTVKAEIPASRPVERPQNDNGDKAVKINSITENGSAPVKFEIGDGQTTRLSPDMMPGTSPEMSASPVAGKFIVKREVMLIHTTESIDV